MFVSMFFPVFLGIVVVLFFCLPVRWRSAVLLLSSYVFCAYIDIRGLAVLLSVSVFGWAAGLRIESMQRRGKRGRSRSIAVWAIMVCVLALCVFKYSGYLVERLGLAEALPESVLKNMVMPVGLSFYLFQVIGYLADIEQGKSCAERNFWFLGCYFAFFAKLVSGPIEREKDFLPQMKRLSGVKFGDRGRLSTAFTYMLWGYFMKMVVADRLAFLVEIIFGGAKEFDSLGLAAGAFFYTMQIYCDFAGYSYIAVGCARIFGIELTQNFKAPYQAENITDFWRRWHISLSSWLRDYLYIPLGGNRKGIFRKCMNTMIVFLVCGMWHGAGLNFVVWGLLHGMYSVIDYLFQRKGRKLPGSRLLTFGAVAFAWIFFRAEDLSHALVYVFRMLTAGVHPMQWKSFWIMLQLSYAEVAVICISIFLIWYVDELCSRKGMHLPFLIQQKQNSVRYFIFYLLLISIFIFGIYGPGYHAEQFIYMQF